MKQNLFLSLMIIITIGSCNNKSNEKNANVDTVSVNNNNTISPPVANHTNVDKIELDKIPALVGPYINKNFKGYIIKNAEYDPLCIGRDAIDIVISKHWTT